MIADGRIRVVTLAGSRLRSIGNLISRLRLRKWLSSRAAHGEIDIIEAPDYLGLVPFPIRGCPVVIRLHLTSTIICAHAEQAIPRGISAYEKRTLLENSNWIAVSNYILEETQKTFCVSPRRSAVIVNPVPPAPVAASQGPEVPSNYVLYAGQLSRRKGALVLAEAMRSLMGSRPDLHLVYAGASVAREGPIEQEIKQILGPALCERVHFLGHLDREKVLSCMRRARVFAFPSRLEAAGLVLLEAMSCGVPVVCTSYPPASLMVEDGATGLLVDPTSPSDIEEKIARLIDDSEFGKHLAAAAREQVAQRFSLESCLDATEGFYHECLRA
jgi:glycosyltransferase involved in cell wall biosynthesis